MSTINLGKVDQEAAAKIEADLDKCVAHMRAIRQDIPDFWKELNASERLGEWLSALGYRKQETSEKTESRDHSSDGGR